MTPAARSTLAALAAGRATSRKLVEDCLFRISHPDGEGNGYNKMCPPLCRLTVISMSCWHYTSAFVSYSSLGYQTPATVYAGTAKGTLR